MNDLSDIFAKEYKKYLKKITDTRITLSEADPSSQQKVIITHIADNPLLIDIDKITPNVEIFQKTSLRKKADYAFITQDAIIIIELKTSRKPDHAREQLLCSKCFLEYCINMAQTIDDSTFMQNNKKIILICLMSNIRRQPTAAKIKEANYHTMKNKIHYFKKCHQIAFDELASVSHYQ